jgi:hypothetical protein
MSQFAKESKSVRSFRGIDTHLMTGIQTVWHLLKYVISCEKETMDGASAGT